MFWKTFSDTIQRIRVSIDNSRFIHTDIFAALIILFLSSGLWLSTIHRWDLWGPDETRYSQISKELIQGSNPFTLHLNGEYYQDKPPFPFWIYAVSLSLNGGFIDSFFLRLPSAIMGGLTLILLYFIGKKLFNKRIGLLSAAILYTAPMFSEECYAVRLDLPLTLWITLAIFSYIYMQVKKGPESLFHFFMFMLSVSAACMTKGPVALIFVLAVTMSRAIAEKSTRPLKEIRPWIGIILSALCLLGWLYAEKKYISSDFVKNQAYDETLKRIFAAPMHSAPIWYYVKSILFQSFVPWSIILLLGLYLLWNDYKNKIAIPVRVKQMLIYILIPLIFFSVVSSKREQYLLPIFPAISLFIAYIISEKLWTFAIDKKYTKTFGWIVILSGCVAAIISAVCMVFETLPNKIDLYPSDISVFLSLLISCGIMISGYFLIKSNNGKTLILSIIPIMAMLAFFQPAVFYQSLNHKKSPLELNLFLESCAQKYKSDVGLLEPINQEYQVYGNYNLVHIDYKTPEQIYLDKPEEMPKIILTRTDKWEKFKKNYNLDDYVLLKSYDFRKSKFSVYAKARPNWILKEEPVKSGTKFSFVFFSDLKENIALLDTMVNLVLDIHDEDPVTAGFLLGDNGHINNNEFKKPFNDFIVKPCKPLTEAGIPFYGVLGNHDYEITGMPEFEMTHPFLNMNGQNYYTVSFGDNFITFFIIDTQTIVTDEKQLAWLNDSLRQSKAKWKIILMHVPAFASKVAHGYSSLVADEIDFNSILKYNIQLVVSGHNHIYERRIEDNGITFVTCGSTGDNTKVKFPEDKHRIVGYDKKNVFFHIEINDNNLHFKAVNSDGKIIDQGDIKQ